MPVICNDSYANVECQHYFDEYPYPLSDFQKYAIEAIVTGNHVLVTAHTGSGKTLPAEFAIRHFTAQGKKVIYTSPIKALSNQKYYEFQQKYADITFGLFTGDIKTNPDAQVLIMTTEILMNTLFRDMTKEQTVGLEFNIDVQNDLACVVFDEVHYINDKERGQVWEKTMLMLPEHIQMVMLSATIDNPLGFATWCESGRNEGAVFNKKVYLASTNKRVVPLTHYGFLTVNEGALKTIKDKALELQIREGTNTLIQLQSENGEFKDTGVHKMKKLLDIFENRRIFMRRQQILNSLALFLRDREMLPAIAFVFSRKHVELCAKEITVPLLEDDSKVPYIVRRECEQIIRKLPNFAEYLALPEYNQLVSLLEKGIGIHHSGMIPVLREIVELMISKKYIKLLFATESFAIGLDCPIKTAIFTSLTKYDGNTSRNLMPHEYTQMAGRAGRRGLDKVGHVVHCNNLFPMPSMNEYKSILCGQPQKLVSKFHVTYSLILNLLKNGVTKYFYKFAERSMINNELIISMEGQKRIIQELSARLEKKKELMNHMRTPYDICSRYLDLNRDSKTLVNKKRKDCDREISNLKNQYSDIEKNSLMVEDYMNILRDHDNETASLQFMEMFIKSQTDRICKILINRGFVGINIEGEYSLTESGKMAASIAEVHSLIMTHFILDNSWFEQFNERQLVGIFSCFTDIKIPEEKRRCVPPDIMHEPLKSLKLFYEEYDDMESAEDIRTGINYYNAIQYDMVELTMQWCDCENEIECKQFIYSELSNKEISVGDFNKAMMKIATVARELAKIAEEMGQIELLHKLSKVDGLIFKYVTTAQSLYL